MSEANSMGVQIFVVPFLILLDVWGVKGGREREGGRERLISGLDTDFIVNPMRIFYFMFYRGISSDTSSSNAEDFSFFTFLIFIIF